MTQRTLSSTKRSLTKVEEILYYYKIVKCPFCFGHSKSTLTNVEDDVVGCGGDCYASTFYKIMLGGTCGGNRGDIVSFTR